MTCEQLTYYTGYKIHCMAIDHRVRL